MNFPQRWIEKAKEDIKAAKLLLDSSANLNSIVCFHAQQAVEKALKAFLTKAGVRTGRTHDIGFLLRLCEEQDEEFRNLPTEELSRLSFYAVQIRYPENYYTPSREEAKKAVDIAEKLISFVEKKL